MAIVVRTKALCILDFLAREHRYLFLLLWFSQICILISLWLFIKRIKFKTSKPLAVKGENKNSRSNIIKVRDIDKDTIIMI
jgi:hypothetical protein